ncbi:MAG: hypothetical protein IJF92_01345 [Bacilli bacterium]|nr:hypothetical protein [Bacilli bacterium]
MKKEEYIKLLLKLEWVIGLTASISLFTLVFTASFIEMNNIIRVLLIVIGFVIFVVGVLYCIKIEQVAGYYQCNNCHNKYIPTYKDVLLSMHIKRTRYMKCPKCGMKTWNKKVIK